MKKDKLHSYTKLMKEFYKRTDIYSFQERMMLLKDYLEFNYYYKLNKKRKKKELGYLCPLKIFKTANFLVIKKSK